MGEPFPSAAAVDSTNHDANGRIGGSHSSASSDHNGSCNGLSLLNGSGASSQPPHPLLTASQLQLNRPTPDLDYLTQLMKDRKQLAAFPNVFTHAERLLDEEINRVRVALFQCEFTREPLQLPDPAGELLCRQEKVFVPVKAYPEYNFVGRILGPRGMTAKQLEAETGCKIMVRGKGSMRDKKKEDANKGKANWEHLQEELHVLIQCEDTPNRLEVKIARAVDEVKKLLVPAPEGEDELKKKQLMELAIINGTYRNGAAGQQQQQQLVQLAQLTAAAAAANTQKGMLLQQQHHLAGIALPPPTTSTGAAIRSPSLAGTPLIMQHQQQQSVVGARNAAAAAAAAQNAALVAAHQQAQLQQVVQAQAAQAQAAQAAQAQALAMAQLNAMGYNTSGGAGGLMGTHPGTVDYQQLLLSSMHQQQQYDPNMLAALQQQQQLAALFQHQQQAAAAAGGGGLLGDYAAMTAAAAAQDAAAGSILSQQRRFLGQQRDHPYGGQSNAGANNISTTSTANGKRNDGGAGGN